MRPAIASCLLALLAAPLAAQAPATPAKAAPTASAHAHVARGKAPMDDMMAKHGAMVATARAAIDAANARAVAAWNAGDVPGFLRIYGDSAWLLPSNSPVIKGKAGITQYWQGGRDMGIRNVKLATIELDAHMDMAQEVGTYAFDIVGKDGAVAGHDQGKYIVLWKKNAAGEWQWMRDIFNTDMPPAPAATPAPAK